MLRRMFIVLWLFLALWSAGCTVTVAVILYQEEARHQRTASSNMSETIARRGLAFAEASGLLALLVIPPALVLAGLQYVLLGSATPGSVWRVSQDR